MQIYKGRRKKIVFFLVTRPLRRGGGDKGLATKKKDRFLKL